MTCERARQPFRFKPAFLVALIGVIGVVAGCGDTSSPPPTIWNLASSGNLDFSNQRHPMTDGISDVDLTTAGALCPAGLGHIGDGREPVDTINIRYAVPRAQTYWLHVTWQPGSSGIEQFAVSMNGALVRNSEAVVAADAPQKVRTSVFEVPHLEGINTLTLTYLSGDGMHFENVALTSTPADPVDVASGTTPPATATEPVEQPVAAPAETPEPEPEEQPGQHLNPSLTYPTLEAYEDARGGAGTLLTSEHVWLFAPAHRQSEAETVFAYLTKAYDALREIVGVDTNYIMVVYHFPDGSDNAWGGTGECSVWYGDSSLDLDRQEEWTKHRIPHVSGYIEEMAHNFVSATHAQFGWEMMGWSIGVKATERVAGNPTFAEAVRSTRRTQQETFGRYMAAGGVFPRDIEPNLVDRLHAHLLYTCEQAYGPSFWPDVFTEIRKIKGPLADAVSEGNGDRIRNARYTLTVDCFDRLPGLEFERMLRDSHISRTVSVKSLHPTEPGWDGRLE